MASEGRRVGKVPIKVREIYPSPSAPSSPFVSAKFTHNERVPASEAENREIRCAQCGAPIEDHTAITACWWCSSNNILGHVFNDC